MTNKTKATITDGGFLTPQASAAFLAATPVFDQLGSLLGLDLEKDEKGIVIFLGAVSTKAQDMGMAVLALLAAGDIQGANDATSQLKAFQADIAAVLNSLGAGAQMIRKVQPLRLIWDSGYRKLYGDPFKTMRETARIVARKWDFPPDAKTAIGA